jgi:hypothetical protein
MATMTNLISSEVEKRFAAAASDARIRPVLGGFSASVLWDNERGRRIARRALLAQEYFSEFGPPRAPRLPLNWEDMASLAKTGDFGLAVSSFARSLELNDWNINWHPRYQEYMNGLLYLPKLRLAFGAFGDLDKLYCYYAPYPLQGIHGNGLWRPVGG